MTRPKASSETTMDAPAAPAPCRPAASPSRPSRGSRGAALFLLVVALLFATVPVSLANEIHIVKKGETLSGIARSHAVSPRQLIEANSLSRSGHIKVGQRLIIPKPTPARPVPGLAAPLRRALDRAPVQAGRWDYIVVHHSATAMGNARAMDRYHREERNMENGLAYHFVIGNGQGMPDGHVFIGHRWTRQLNGGHLASEALNTRALGICLVGNFDQQKPTAKQLVALDLLTEYLMQRCRISRSGVKTHQEINPIGTRCPGRLFDEEAFRKGLK